MLLVRVHILHLLDELHIYGKPYTKIKPCIPFNTTGLGCVGITGSVFIASTVVVVLCFYIFKPMLTLTGCDPVDREESTPPLILRI